jgi:tripartite-type tricarboxylate transporter receptor subunit TctC
LQDYVLCTNPELSANSVRELIALAKAKPRTLSYASAGAGTGSHLSGELLSQLGGVELIHAAYKGMAPALTDVIGGQVAFTFASTASALPMIKAAKVKPLAVTGPRRSPLLPQVPTMQEAGIPGYASSTWYGIVAPAGTPQAIIDKLHREIVAALRDPNMQRTFAEEGIDPIGDTPQEFRAFMSSEIDKWRNVIKRAGIRPD